jgi:chaperonin GroEL
MGIHNRKIKSVAKMMMPKGAALEAIILKTMKQVSDIVGATLGPGGCPVLIERAEYNFPNLITKDGVTVFRSIGYDNAIQHAIMEAARDASVRTATEAGDGTTTATVLAEAIVRRTHEFCKRFPKVSPQRAVRVLERFFRKEIEPFIRSLAMKPDSKLLYAVAKCSANGDTELADAIAKCFELTGDDGNVTLTEQSGPSHYEVEALKGYPVGIGYEDSAGKFWSVFQNDAANARIYMENPIFVLYHGTVNEIQVIAPLMEKIGERWGDPRTAGGPNNVVLVACGFSDAVLGELAGGWSLSHTINVYPMRTPQFPTQSGQLDFLLDLQHVTGSVVFDPITRPIQQGDLSDIGPSLDYFEAFRYRSNIVGHADPELVMARVEELQAQLPNAESILETNLLNERIGKLSGGIARLRIFAPTTGELREKRDRAEDAACAWRGAVKHGALPGGGWTLLKTVRYLERLKLPDFEYAVVHDILAPALMEPLLRLLQNCGFSSDEIASKLIDLRAALENEEPVIYDALEDRFELAKDSGVIDSLPAVLEAIRNSISIAALLGTLGGTIVFPRDTALERQEASDTLQWQKDAGIIS